MIVVVGMFVVVGSCVVGLIVVVAGASLWIVVVGKLLLLKCSSV